jgi:hypothetical protein
MIAPEFPRHRIDLERMDEQLDIALIAQVAALAQLGHRRGEEGIARVDGRVLGVAVLDIRRRVLEGRAVGSRKGTLNGHVRHGGDAKAARDGALGVENRQAHLGPWRNAEQKGPLRKLRLARLSAQGVSFDRETLIRPPVDRYLLGGVGRHGEIEYHAIRVGPEEAHYLLARVIRLSLHRLRSEGEERAREENDGECGTSQESE